MIEVGFDQFETQLSQCQSKTAESRFWYNNLLLRLDCPKKRILPAALIEETLKEENLKCRQRLYTPIVTLWAFLSQVLDTDKTCHNAVSRVIAWLAAKGEKIPLLR